MLLSTFSFSCLAGVASGFSATHKARLSGHKSPETPYFRDYFYAGGSYTIANDSATGLDNQLAFQGQMYAERLIPLTGANHMYPVVMIHGAGQSGTNFLNTPDGRKGWASYLLEKGYEVYIVDQTARARSAWAPGNGTLTWYPAEFVERMFTASQDFNLWPQAHLHTQWPGTGRIGDPIFDAFFASGVQLLQNQTFQELSMQSAGIDLLDTIGPAILMAHSQGGLYPWLWADTRPELVKGIWTIEPAGPPFHDEILDDATARAYGLTDIPLTFEPPALFDTTAPLEMVVHPSNNPNRSSCILQAEPPRQLVNLRDIPILLQTSESGFNAFYDHCTVAFLKQAGARKVEHLRLEEVGILGNGHMQFMEKNSEEIVRYVEEGWLKGIE